MVKKQKISEFIHVDEKTDYLHIEIPQSYATSTLISGLLSVYLFFQKLRDNLLASWQACCYPIFIVLIYKFISSFIEILKDSNLREVLTNFYGQNDDIIVKLENLILLSNLFNLIHYSLCAFCCIFFTSYLDTKEDDYLFYFITVIVGMILNQLLFSFLSSTSWFNIKSKSTSNLSRDDEANPNSKQEESLYDSAVAFGASLVTPILTYFSNMMILCSANSGVCTQFYLSTLTSILGAFGINISNISEYLFPITVILLLVSNISLYIKRKKLTHPPFLLGVFSTFLIILSKIYEENLWMLNYVGSVLILVAAIWNARVNKFFGLPSRNKK